MTSAAPFNAPFGLPPPAVPVIQVPPHLRVDAATRLIAPGVPNPRQAGAQLVNSAPLHGIDLALFWATLDPTTNAVRQACLAVVGSGRTAMLFVSSSSSPGAVAGEGRREAAKRDHAERACVIRRACDHLASLDSGSRVRLAQILLEPHESDAVQAALEAGFLRLGDLAYLRKPLPRRRTGTLPDHPAGGVTLAPLSAYPADQRDHVLTEALERSYEGTLDCPELCGLRETGDVIASHRAVGRFDPALWWIVSRDQQPVGCVLLSFVSEQAVVELVYIGISPELRGRGIASALLTAALHHPLHRQANAMVCAVDTRNAPACAMYERLGFKQFALRVPLVRAIP